MDWGNHHMGTTRMHVDPKQGVVNANSQVYGVANLHIMRTGVFPTYGASRPDDEHAGADVAPRRPHQGVVQMSNWKSEIARRPFLTGLFGLLGLGVVGGTAYESAHVLHRHIRPPRSTICSTCCLTARTRRRSAWW